MQLGSAEAGVHIFPLAKAAGSKASGKDEEHYEAQPSVAHADVGSMTSACAVGAPGDAEESMSASPTALAKTSQEQLSPPIGVAAAASPPP